LGATRGIAGKETGFVDLAGSTRRWVDPDMSSLDDMGDANPDTRCRTRWKGLSKRATTT
jgi:hypothetical protein